MIFAVVTAYKPDAQFVDRFRALLGPCAGIVVSDNTPGGSRVVADLPDGFHVLQHGRNSGLGPALNDGIARARELGARTVILFDQDSTPSPDLVLRLAKTLASAREQHGPRCVVGPTHVDDTRVPPVSTRGDAVSAADLASLGAVSCLPTSGLAVPVDALKPGDGFAADLFLDLVDFEWCWRLGASGWRFWRAGSIVMPHRLGIAERRLLGMTFYVPAPYRHYFQVRDTLRLAVRRYMPWYSRVRLVAVLPVKAVAYPFLLDRGAERFRWMLRGLRDALRGIGGVGAASERLS